MKSTDMLMHRFPNIEGDKLAAAGASYGGYMAAWILGHTDRFKALVNHAGVNNSYSQFATDGPHGFGMVMGGTPWGDVEGLQRNNPMFYAKNFKTPTLVIHGDSFRVPTATHGLYGALQAQWQSRLVIFPIITGLKPQTPLHWHWDASWLALYIGASRRWRNQSSSQGEANPEQSLPPTPATQQLTRGCRKLQAMRLN